MCVVVFDYQPDGSKPYILIVVSNRDEYYDRKTAQADFWNDNPVILAGRDLKEFPNGGTWIGVSKNGRFSVVTNIRKIFKEPTLNDISRGLIVSEFLGGVSSSPMEYCQQLLKKASDYDGFNLITAQLGSSDSRQLTYCSNKLDEVQILGSGTYTLSNEFLNTPWAKATHGKKLFEEVISRADVLTKEQLTEQLLGVLSDTTCLHPDPNVPDTQHPDDWIKRSNSVFVQIPYARFGTRTSTVILVDNKGEVTFTEKTMIDPIDSNDPKWNTKSFSFNIQNKINSN